ncbi:MAG: matrixin family metalloprotease, partial [Acidimicrobiia bacterium]|nr:matrixin family metalloprotease [Acidimicrobiia bacterium]
ACCAAALFVEHAGDAFWFNDVRWPAGSFVDMHLQMGAAGGLTDGSASWDAVAETALALWNPFLPSVAFRVVRNSGASRTFSNGANNVFWDTSFFGSSFGDAVAVTRWSYRVSDRTLVEADVVFNDNLRWNAYRGNLISDADGRVYDLRRVALHEFGHVLGLGHPDDNGQTVAAIMNRRISNVDALQTDDLLGALSIYATSVPGNRAPAVSVTCDPCSVEVGQTTTLRAIATDPDGDAVTLIWTIAQGVLSTASAASTSWRAPAQPATVTATITANDGRGGVAAASVTLTVVFHDRLQSTWRLQPGQELSSGNRRYRLLYQHDGNLVLYDAVEGTAPWHSGTGGTSPGFATLQGDGNFVIYDAGGTPVFNTGTRAIGNTQLYVQDDGNLVLYGPDGRVLWARTQ